MVVPSTPTVLSVLLAGACLTAAVLTAWAIARPSRPGGAGTGQKKAAGKAAARSSTPAVAAAAPTGAPAAARAAIVEGVRRVRLNWNRDAPRAMADMRRRQADYTPALELNETFPELHVRPDEPVIGADEMFGNPTTEAQLLAETIHSAEMGKQYAALAMFSYAVPQALGDTPVELATQTIELAYAYIGAAQDLASIGRFELNKGRDRAHTLLRMARVKSAEASTLLDRASDATLDAAADVNESKQFEVSRGLWMARHDLLLLCGDHAGAHEALEKAIFMLAQMLRTRADHPMPTNQATAAANQVAAFYRARVAQHRRDYTSAIEHWRRITPQANGGSEYEYAQVQLIWCLIRTGQPDVENALLAMQSRIEADERAGRDARSHEDDRIPLEHRKQDHAVLAREFLQRPC